jgi:hypothetical protein
MATASKIQLVRGQWPEYYRPAIQQDATNKASELLQKNHEEHHIFFNAEGFHNHIVHHLLTIWALRAGPREVQRGYDVNQGYQRPQPRTHKDVSTAMHEPDEFTRHLGDENYYSDYLSFFQNEIQQSSWQDVGNKYLFARDRRADDMLVRLFGGLLHPIIHFGFGVEFHQPAIVAEALAQTAVHGSGMGKLLLPTEQAAQKQSQSKTIVELLDEIHADEKLRNAPRWSDPNKIRDGILARAGDRMIHHASQFHVKPDDLERKTAEHINAVAYFTAGAQRPEFQRKYDFYYVHSVTSSIFFSSFVKQDWLSTEDKVRLLEWKVRMDLAVYASRKSPYIRLEDVRSYKPKQPSGWDAIHDRVIKLDDDGHASKLIRALAHGQQVCGPYEDREEFRVKHDDWLKMGHMAIDSVEGPGANWLRSVGFDEAWENVSPRAQL